MEGLLQQGKAVHRSVSVMFVVCLAVQVIGVVALVRRRQRRRTRHGKDLAGHRDTGGKGGDG